MKKSPIQYVGLGSHCREALQWEVFSLAYRHATLKGCPTGQAFIEFLIVFPSLFLIFMAVVFFGKGYIAKARMDVAARYAAWKQGRTGEAVSEDRLSELYFPEEGRRAQVFDPGPPSIAGIEWLRDLNDIIDRLGRTEERGVRIVLDAPHFFPSGVGISSAHYVDIKAWDDRTVLAAAGLWGLAIAKGFVSAKTPGTCYGGGVKVVLYPFIRKFLEKKADDVIEGALESGVEKLKDVIAEKVEEWMGEISGAFSLPSSPRAPTEGGSGED